MRITLSALTAMPCASSHLPVSPPIYFQLLLNIGVIQPEALLRHMAAIGKFECIHRVFSMGSDMQSPAVCKDVLTRAVDTQTVRTIASYHTFFYQRKCFYSAMMVSFSACRCIVWLISPFINKSEDN